MFTGIVEALGEVEKIKADGGNLVFTIKSDITHELQIDQSVAHNGVCLTVSVLETPELYQVVAVPETLQRSNLRQLNKGDLINLERSMIFGGRVDGHLVQGHVDQTAICKSINEIDGSWEFIFDFDINPSHVLIEKGSICINGVSLTCYNLVDNSFQVSVIPYTYQNTNFKNLEVGKAVNLEFDMIGKYIQKSIKLGNRN